MRKYTNKELELLHKNEEKLTLNSLEIVVKESGKCMGPGYADPFDQLVVDSYLRNPEDIYHPYVSPALAKDLTGLPDTVIVTAEYDGLRLQGELYGRKLKDAGNQVEVVRYAGTFHAFFDRLGYVPQAEAVCNDIVERLNK